MTLPSTHSRTNGIGSIAGLVALMATACAAQVGGSPDPEVGVTSAVQDSDVSLVSTTVSQNPLAAGETETTIATLRSASSRWNMIVDIRIYNASNEVVTKQTFEPVNLPAGTDVALQFDYASPSSLPDGTYNVQVGVWDQSWATWLYETPTTFTVGGAGPSNPPPTNPPPKNPPPTTSCSFPDWVEYQYYAAGSIVMYQGSLYRAKYANPGYIPTVSTYYWEPYTCSGPTTTPPNTTPPPPSTTSGNLPAKIVGGYFTTWDFRNGVTLRTVIDNTNYNLIYVAFATGVNASSGSLQLSFPAGVGSAADFKSQIAYANSKGKYVIVSVGGYFDLPNNNSGYRLDSTGKVDQFMASMRDFHDNWGFNGMDWDLEHGERPDVSGIVSASQRMKSEFGSSWIIAAAPGVNLSTWVGSGGVMDSLGANGWDLIGEQVYDWGISESEYRAKIIDRMTVLSNKYGASKVMLGNKYKTDEAGNSSLADPQNVCVDISTTTSALAALRSAGKTIRGSFVWNIQSDADAGYQWQATGGVGGDILSH